ncbi:MAG: DEAD/DEAH box helicase family protein, partial [Parachlamydia sp.]|nr:DEAD/DEAH box helicase family protein [Parachlamydia sp.]
MQRAGALRMEYPAYASVLLDLALDRLLEYGVLPSQVEKAVVGARVEVPVRGKFQIGTLLGLKDRASFPKVLPLANILSDGSLIPHELLNLCHWVSHYYCAPLREVLKMAMPPGVRKGMKEKEQLYVMRGKPREALRAHCIAIREKKPAQAAVLETMLQIKKGILLTKLLETAKSSRSSVQTLVKNGFLVIETVKIDRSPLVDEEFLMTKPKNLNDEQQDALAAIVSSLHSNAYHTHLLYGVTGSGKTEVYLQSIECCLKSGKSALMLVPEIALTSQTIERFRSRFAEKIAVLHHRLSAGERRDEWFKIHQ